ncbi:phospho-N-acetylmuramoyl-pentapeptide-transferase [Aeromicrobium wangtongii]|uniref:Phospho-N-acetylmuramoyl-pentapeptide-transferase n=1 Tax=Aeromicrobium wangtongii TaxID=2969247 RepID=A0ABY5MCV1_9ACTN|nr:phospho-N-acetylmuramoyl-pentapeptide-transferase [Aeromicrobium wangtongii]MCD9197547.1 phospho-N-acetylmuramoyl-pentapeptide-transferase [Aeromicrobium wangtongii]UUP15039.1 phospho-N-acetylmuramoyl-pentapeptide-transferase [Aeromicrobium wangtongii]
MKAILIAGALSLLVTLIGTRFAISVLVKQGYGQLIRDDGPTSHHTKRGTPTMGGLVIIIAVLVGYFAAKLATQTAPSASAMLLLFLFVGLGAIGFLDDFIKVSKQRNLGLRSKAKLVGQTVIGLIFAWLAIMWEDDAGRTPITHAISFTRDFDGWRLPTALLVIWVLLLVAGASNGVNLTDGLDGLATGAAMMVFGAYVFINIWQSGQNCATNPGIKCYEVRDPLDLAVVASALTGACFGFLWWNASPAKIFMGDTGSLSLGGAMAGFALMTRTELLLVIIGGLFVAITMSVILQVGWFKLSGGKRIFRMAPLQHHFELLGWAEITIVVRFWIISGLCVATGLGIFYSEWVTGV